MANRRNILNDQSGFQNLYPNLLDDSGIFVGDMNANRNDIITYNIKRRAANQLQRFNNGTTSFGGANSYGNSIYNSMNTISNAFNALSQMLDNANMRYMYDNQGYFAWETTDARGNPTFSTSLSKLRSLMRLNGKEAEASNRLWSPCIAWHKFLNVGNYYTNKYAAMSIQDAYAVGQRTRAKNLQKKIVYYTKNTDKLQEKINSLAASRRKLIERYNRFDAFYSTVSRVAGAPNPNPNPNDGN